MEEMLLKVLFLILSSALSESIIEFVFAPLVTLVLPDTEEAKPKRTVVFNTLSALLGVGICLNFDFGFFALWGQTGHILFLDYVLTGIVLGRGADYTHQFILDYVFKKQE